MILTVLIVLVSLIDLTFITEVTVLMTVDTDNNFYTSRRLEYEGPWVQIHRCEAFISYGVGESICTAEFK